MRQEKDLGVGSWELGAQDSVSVKRGQKVGAIPKMEVKIKVLSSC